MAIVPTTLLRLLLHTELLLHRKGTYNTSLWLTVTVKSQRPNLLHRLNCRIVASFSIALILNAKTQKVKMNPAKRDTISPPREMSLEERMHLTGRVPQETTTVSKAYFNLTVCVIASALLSIPYSFDKTGSYFI